MPKRPPKEAPDPIDTFVGGRIRERRVGMRISQTKLGEAIGVTFQQIQKYENGANRVGASNLYKISRALGTDIGFFFDGIEDFLQQPQPASNKGLSDGDAPPFDSDPLATREGIELVYNYFRIEDEGVQRRIFDLIRSLKAGGPLSANDD